MADWAVDRRLTSHPKGVKLPAAEATVPWSRVVGVLLQTFVSHDMNSAESTARIVRIVLAACLIRVTTHLKAILP